LTNVPRPRTLPLVAVVPLVAVPRPIPPLPLTLPVLDPIPLPRDVVDEVVVFLRIPRPRVGVLALARVAASSFACSAASAAF